MFPVVLLAATATAACPPADIAGSPQLVPQLVPQLADVTAGPRLAFSRTSDCADAACRTGAYVVPGDRVIVYQQADGRRCAIFEATRETAGWVDSDRLKPDPTASRPSASAWVGTWYDGDDRIRLRPHAGGRLDVDGDAYWPSAHPADRKYGPNIGSLNGIATVSANRADYTDGGDASYSCRATMRLLRDYLLVTDNGNCGGMNVRFTGIYRRKHARS